jgi:hypothetical protein
MLKLSGHIGPSGLDASMGSTVNVRERVLAVALSLMTAAIGAPSFAQAQSAISHGRLPLSDRTARIDLAKAPDPATTVATTVHAFDLATLKITDFGDLEPRNPSSK